MLATLLAVAEEAAAEAEGSLEVLPDTDELRWGAVFFFILVIAMVKFVGPKIRATFAQRTARIQGQLEEAERVKLQADQVLQEYRDKLGDARSEVARIIEEGKRTAEALRADIVAKAEAEAREIVQRAQADVAGERDRAVQQLRSTLGDLSIQLASRVIEKELSTTESHRALVDRAIEELNRSGNGSN